MNYINILDFKLYNIIHPCLYFITFTFLITFKLCLGHIRISCRRWNTTVGLNCSLNSPFAAPVVIMVDLWIVYNIRFFVDLSSHGVTYEIQVGCLSVNLGDFYMQISAAIIEKSNLFNIVKRMHDIFITIVFMPMFSRSVIRLNTIRKFQLVYLFPICKLATAIIANLLFQYIREYVMIMR